ncbi:MAG: hypothetical protein FWH12_02225 [Treponema sp.]|nr:hypothetical protein [Treponema sp.]
MEIKTVAEALEALDEIEAFLNENWKERHVITLKKTEIETIGNLASNIYIKSMKMERLAKEV